MIKVIGFLIIVISSAKIGFDLSKKYINRTRELKSFVYFLERLKNETVKNMLNYMYDKINKNNVSPWDAFNDFIKNDSLHSFCKADVDEIGRFFSCVGSGDRQDEIENICNVISNIKVNLANAAEDEKKYVKLYRTSGILAGFMIAVILA